jgi:serine/threonine-protein kinase HipA
MNGPFVGCYLRINKLFIKYESQGGPGIRPILDQLNGSSQAQADRRDFFRTQVLFWMLAAIDGHAKNFSIFIESKGFYRLTPRYDVLSAHPVMGHGAGSLSSHKVKMAMAIDGKNRHYKWSEIRRDHFEHTAQRCHLPDAPALICEFRPKLDSHSDGIWTLIPTESGQPKVIT